MKKAKKTMESSLFNKSAKNSLSEKRDSIVKSFDKLVSSIVSNEANSAASASMMLMLMLLHMQQQAFMQSQVEIQMKGIEERLLMEMINKE
jgi:hypothetical protein